MDEIKLKALAKINLGLDVVRRREDGYHEVRMVMQTIHLYDQLLIQKSETPGIQIHSNLSFLPVNENNLVYKAGKLLMDEFDIHTGVSVELNKRIPVAAGMAGGCLFRKSAQKSHAYRQLGLYDRAGRVLCGRRGTDADPSCCFCCGSGGSGAGRRKAGAFLKNQNRSRV